MRATLFLIVSFWMAAWLPQPSSAQSFIPMNVTPKVTKGPLLDGKIYAVDIKCKKTGNLEDAIDRNIFFTNTRTHMVLISTAPPTSAAGGDKLPDATLAAVQVFSVDKATTFVDRTDCDHHFLLAGGKRYYLVGAINILDDFASSPAGTVLSNLAAIATPLFSLFTGDPLPAIVSTKMSNVQSLVTPFQNILAALNRGVNSTKIIDGLRVGTYEITTNYTSVTVTVRPVPSIVLDENSVFRVDFRDKINAAPEKIDTTNLDKSCRAVRGGLTQSSFTAREDIAYALIALGARVGLARNDILKCLTLDYAPAATKFPDSVWISFPTELRFDQAVMENVLPESSGPSQPEFDAIHTRFDQTVTALAQYARNTPKPPSAIATLSKYLAANVSIIDKTADFKITESVDPMDRFKAIEDLTSKGYIRFGCYAATTDATDKGLDGSPVMLLVFNAPSDATSTTVDKALVLRPLFKDRIITTFIVSFNRKYVTSVLSNPSFDYDCNGFTVEKPKT
ncbi:hypothetical protein [Bradyrhizobium sp. cf659]|uniref:hypothetical protein n=1 Tax=Bradyrhizobium sp. cf659 TaxID=1761771 RepID=UPI0008EED8A1|nr:hypothetical protein [Bradyrhizobium sp. cf659]SFJ93859.1 hypothetical protein SAMN04487925_113139 [Bradyrhizobium sp. cf659]